MNKNIIIVGIIGFILIVGYFGFSKYQKDQNNMQGTQPTPADAMKPPGTNVDIEMKNFSFGPNDVTIKVGETVTWTNRDSANHNVVANDGSFKSETLANGQSFSHTFTTPGTFDYVCTFHAPMKAKITVQ